MKNDEKLIPVRDTHRFNEDRLANYLTIHLAGFEGPLELLQFEGGQSNPTFLLGTQDKQYVLRKKPPGTLLPSAHMIEREYRIMKALEHTGVPVPRMFMLCEDDAVIGVTFFVMEYCRLTGRDSIPNWNFYLAFSFFRLASILQGVYKRGIMGNASSSEALEKGRMARDIADIAWKFLE